MDLLIEAVKYFVSVTGKEWFVFYDLLESADWLVTSLRDTSMSLTGEMNFMYGSHLQVLAILLELRVLSLAIYLHQHYRKMM